ncbi:PRTRC system protein A [Luteimonas sp. BDR2-5]|uniref:PRTRC system protein A n=1 Tax=Proluteimonas luteida TaxID=2878685 RepID=UPI001E519FB4|nr:PRTRC system protein A [Luteimonas sp. BDR2-5]MCD9026825.1 PRTRC system protein A [Luteimonas sp. BDR2-5]
MQDELGIVDARDLALQASCPLLAVPRFGALPPMENGQRILVAANGVFAQFKLDWLDCIQRLAPPAALPLPYGEVEERLRFAFGRLPIHLIEQFVDEGRKRLPDEAAGALVYSRASGALRLVMHAPVSASPGHITYGVPTLAADDTLAVDLHTHGRLPAFWSPTDDCDDTGIKVAGVFGDLHRPQPTAAFRLVLNGLYRALPHPWPTAEPPARAPERPEEPPVEAGVLRRILRAILG